MAPKRRISRRKDNKFNPASYAKNVLKSAKYIGLESIKGIDESLTNSIVETKEDILNVVDVLKNFKSIVREKAIGIVGEEGIDELKKVPKNFWEDFKSGKWYNPERENAQTEAFMKSQGLSFDFDFDDFDLDDDDEPSSSRSDDSDTVTSSTVQNASNVISAAQFAAADASAVKIISGNRTNTKAVMSQNERLFGTLNFTMANVNKSIMSLHQDISEPLNIHFNNSLSFFQTATTELAKQTSILDNINNLLTARFAPVTSGNKGLGGRKVTDWEKVMGTNTDNLPSIKNWLKIAKDRAITDNSLDMLGMLDPEMIKMVIGSGMLASPVAGLAKLILGNRLKKGAIGKSVVNFREMLSDTTMRIAGKISAYNKKGEKGILGTLANLFDIGVNDKSKLGGWENYNKGRADWTGKDSKALREVIPIQLGQILSAITGKEPKIFNYDTGRWETPKHIQKEFLKRKELATASATSKLKESVIDQFIEEDRIANEGKDIPIYTKNSRAVINLSKEYDKLISLLIGTGADISNFATKEDLNKYCEKRNWVPSTDNNTNGGSYLFTKKTFDTLVRLIYGDGSSRRMGQIQSSIYNARIAKNKFLSDAASESGIGIITNGSDIYKAGKFSPFNVEDRYGNSVFNYLQDYYYQLRTIANNTGRFSIVNSGKNKKSSSRADRISRNREYQEQDPYLYYGYAEESAASGTPRDFDSSSGTEGGDDYDPDGRFEYNKRTGGYVKSKSTSSSKATRNKEEKSNFISRGIDKLTEWTDKIIFGTTDEAEQNKFFANGGLVGAFSKFPETIKKVFESAVDKVKGFFKGIWDRIRGSEGFKEYREELKTSIKSGASNTWEYATDRAGKIFKSVTGKETAPWEAKVEPDNNQPPLNYKGGYVTKSGMASVSEGEYIIPAKYTGYGSKISDFTRKAIELKNYKLWKKDHPNEEYYGSYAEGGEVKSKKKHRLENLPEELKETVETLTNQGKEPGQIANKINVSTKAIKDYLKDPLRTLTAYERNKIKEAIKSGLSPETIAKKCNVAVEKVTETWGYKYNNFKENTKVGRVYSKAAEGAKKIAKRERDLFFGLDEEDQQNADSITDEAKKVIKSNLPSTLAKGTIGAIIGAATTGSGLGLLGGFVTGAGYNIISHSEEISKKLFGYTDADGEYNKGLLPKGLSTFIKDKLPGATKAGGIGALIGAMISGSKGGMLVGMAAGAGLELLSSTDTFKDMMFGKPDKDGKRTGDGGLIGAIKDTLLGRKGVDGERHGGIKDALRIHVLNPIEGFISNGMKNITEYVKNDIFNPLKRFVKPVGEGFVNRIKTIGVTREPKNTVRRTAGEVSSSVIGKASKLVRSVTNPAWKTAKKIVSAPAKALGYIGDNIRVRNISKGYSSLDAEERIDAINQYKENPNSLRRLNQWVMGILRISKTYLDSKFDWAKNWISSWVEPVLTPIKKKLKEWSKYLNDNILSLIKDKIKNFSKDTLTRGISNIRQNRYKKLYEEGRIDEEDYNDLTARLKEKNLTFGDLRDIRRDKRSSKRKVTIKDNQKYRLFKELNDSKISDEDYVRLLDQLQSAKTKSEFKDVRKELNKITNNRILKAGASRSIDSTMPYNQWTLGKDNKDILMADYYLNEGNSELGSRNYKERQNLANLLTASMKNGGAGNEKTVKKLKALFNTDKVRKDNDFSDVESMINELLQQDLYTESDVKKIKEQISNTKEKINLNNFAISSYTSSKDDFIKNQLGIDNISKKDLKRIQRQANLDASKIYDKMDEEELTKFYAERTRLASAQARNQLLREQEMENPLDARRNEMINNIEEATNDIRSAIQNITHNPLNANKPSPIGNGLDNLTSNVAPSNPLDRIANNRTNSTDVKEDQTASTTQTNTQQQETKSGVTQSPVNRTSTGNALDRLTSNVAPSNPLDRIANNRTNSTPNDQPVPSPVPDAEGNLMEFIRDSNGEPIPDKTDASTVEAINNAKEDRKLRNGFFKKVLGGKGLFGKGEGTSDEDTEESEKKGSFLSGILSKVLGDSGIVSAFTTIANLLGAKGGIVNLLSSIVSGVGSIKSLLPTIGLGIALSAVGKKNAGTRLDSGMNSSIDPEERAKEVSKKGIFYKMKLGADAIENRIRKRDTTTYSEDDFVSEYESSRVKKSLAKNALISLNQGSKLAKAGSWVVKNTVGRIPGVGKVFKGSTNIGSTVSKISNKIWDVATDPAKTGKLSQKVSAGVINVFSKVKDKGVSLLKKAASTKIGKTTVSVISSVKEKLLAVIKTVAKKIGISGSDDVIEEVVTEGAEQIAKKGGKSLSKLLSKVGLIMYIASIVNAVTEGLQKAKAKTILGIIDDPTTGQRLLAAAINGLNAAIPGIGGIIPSEFIFSVVFAILKALGLNVGKLDEQRSNAKAVVAAYNKENGTTYNIEEYIHNVLGEYTVQEKVGKWVKGLFKKKDKNKTDKELDNVTTIEQDDKEKTKENSASGSSIITDADIRKTENQLNKPASSLTNIQNNSKANYTNTASGTNTKNNSKPFKDTDKKYNTSITKGSGLKGGASGTSNSQYSIISSAISPVPNMDNIVKDLWKYSDPTYDMNSYDDILESYKNNNNISTFGKETISMVCGVMKLVDTVIRPFRYIVNIVGKDISNIVSVMNQTYGLNESSTDIRSGGSKVINWVKNGLNKAWSWLHGNKSSDEESGSASGIHTEQKGNFRKFGRSTIDKDGCGPAVASTVLKAYGKNIGINDTASYAESKGYVAGNSGTSGTKASFFGDILGNNGINTRYTDNKNQINSAALSGNPTILLGQDNGNKSKVNSPFGPNPHYVVARGSDSKGNIIVDDPELGRTTSYKKSILSKVKMGIATGGDSGTDESSESSTDILSPDSIISTALGAAFGKMASNLGENSIAGKLLKYILGGTVTSTSNSGTSGSANNSSDSSITTNDYSTEIISGNNTIKPITSLNDIPSKYNKLYNNYYNNGISSCVTGSPKNSSKNVLSNCVGWACARFNHIYNLLTGYDGIKYPAFCCNAEKFIEIANEYGLKVGQIPQVGAIMVWQKGKLGKVTTSLGTFGTEEGNGDGAGHVAIVEKVLSDTKVETSESAWAGSAFKTYVRTKGNNERWDMGPTYTFRGFIYNPAVTYEITNANLDNSKANPKFTESFASGSGITDITRLTKIPKAYYIAGDSKLFKNTKKKDNLDTKGNMFKEVTPKPQVVPKDPNIAKKIMSDKGSGSGVKSIDRDIYIRPINNKYNQVSGGASNTKSSIGVEDVKKMIEYLSSIATNTSNNTAIPTLVDVVNRLLQIVGLIGGANSTTTSANITNYEDEIRLMQAKLNAIAQNA